MMKGHSNRSKVSGSPASDFPHTSSPREDAHRSPSAISSERINSKRKQPFDEENNSPVLLSNVSKKARTSLERVLHGRSINRSGGSFITSNWYISPVKNTSDVDDSDSSGGMDCLNNISEINKSILEESSDSSLEYHSKNLTTKDFDSMLQTAADTSDVDSNDYDYNFFQAKKEEFQREVKPELKRFSKGDDTYNVSVNNFSARNCIVVMMNHPASFTLNDYVSVQVLSGVVSIYGHELKPRCIPVNVFSSRGSGLVEVKTEHYDRLWMRKESSRNLTHKLAKVTGNLNTARELMNKFGGTTVVVLIQRCVFPRSLCFVELYHPEELKFKPTKQFLKKYFGKNKRNCPNRDKRIYCLPNNENSVQFGPEAEDLASEIIAAIRTSKLWESPGPRIMIFGPKNTGKSSILRYLMNKALSMFPVVYYLDTDPGKTEFTPPGVVSLTEVTKAVIGPAFCHQRQPLSMAFTGGLSADVSPDMYSRSVSKLAALFTQNYSSEPLFVNTMGWIQGLGQECLKNVMKAVSPTILVEMMNNEDEAMFDYQNYLNATTKFYQIKSNFSPIMMTDKIPPCKQRDLSLLAYFGRCKSLHERPTYLNAIQPVCVSWDKIPVYLFSKKIAPFRMVEALNTSVVALCKVDTNLILESTNPNLPKTLVDDPDNECIGYGIVRAIDEAKHLLYIITPLRMDEMKHVNVILKGNIMLPDSVLLNQPIFGDSLAFTDDRRDDSKTDDESSSADESVSKVSYKYHKSIKAKCNRRKKRKQNGR